MRFSLQRQIILQKRPFFTSNIMRVLYSKNIDNNQSEFVVEQLKKLTKNYNWSFKFSGPVVMNSEINLPIKNKKDINFEEMKKIGSFIANINDLITLHQRELICFNRVLIKTSLLNLYLYFLILE